MVTWIQIEDGTGERWDYVPGEPTPDRHILRYNGDTRLFGELHRNVLHRYALPDGLPVDPVWPLNEANWVDTVIVTDPIESDEQAWGILAEAIAP